ncbi:MAG: hypothetical protein EPN93_17270 [Spirochaetes bacterium]|nr:MAG: hypothetical protein EPN93_17270 [Spirochaetota bacterium]
MASPSKIRNAIPLVLISMFAMLVVAEAAGVRVHHADSVEMVRALPGNSGAEGESSPSGRDGCRNDETIIEHVIHDAAFSVQVKAPDQPRATSYAEAPLRFSVAMWTQHNQLFTVNFTLSHKFIGRDHHDRAPPVSTY